MKIEQKEKTQTAKSVNVNDKIINQNTDRRLHCFEQICPTSTDSEFDALENLSESQISPLISTHYSLSRVGAYGKKLLDLHVEDRLKVD